MAHRQSRETLQTLTNRNPNRRERKKSEKAKENSTLSGVCVCVVLGTYESCDICCQLCIARSSVEQREWRSAFSRRCCDCGAPSAAVNCECEQQRRCWRDSCQRVWLWRWPRCVRLCGTALCGVARAGAAARRRRAAQRHRHAQCRCRCGGGNCGGSGSGECALRHATTRASPHRTWKTRALCFSSAWTARLSTRCAS
jgi:hypothetical protein